MAIKKNTQNLIYQEDNGTSVRKEHDLLLYLDDGRKMQPQVNLKNDENMQHQHDNSIKLESQNHEIKFKTGAHTDVVINNDNFYLSPSANHPNQNNRLTFSGFSNDFKYSNDQMLNATSQNGNSYRNYMRHQHQQPNIRISGINDRFSINQPEIVENSKTTGVINHHHYHDFLGHDIGNEKTESKQPNVIDVRVKFGNHHENIDPDDFGESCIHSSLPKKNLSKVINE